MAKRQSVAMILRAQCCLPGGKTSLEQPSLDFCRCCQPIARHMGQPASDIVAQVERVHEIIEKRVIARDRAFLGYMHLYTSITFLLVDIFHHNYHILIVYLLIEDFKPCADTTIIKTPP